MTKISVAIPAYNAELYLRQALDSVLTQACKAYEIILVNDGSTDRTEEIALSYGSNIRYVKQTNQGLAAARNTAIREASADWIAFFDSDDIMMPDKLCKQSAAIEANPDLILVYSAFTYLFTDGKTQEIAAFPAKDLWPTLRYRTPILPSTSVIRRSALLEVGGFRSVMTEDWDLWVRLVRRYTSKAFQEVPQSLILYRQVDNSLSKKFMNMTRGNMDMLNNVTLEDLSGISKIIWRRKIEAKIYYSHSIALRDNFDERYWAFAIESILMWPFFGKVVPLHRYLVMANMLYRKILNFQLRFRYWWPLRRCREELLSTNRSKS
jgi:glycosyltransferase involved in cell wall biosynthesis